MPEHAWIWRSLAHFTFHGSLLIPVICHTHKPKICAPPVSETDVCVYRTASESHTSAHTQNKHLLNQATIPKPPSHRLPNLFPLLCLSTDTPPLLTALCCKYKTQAADCQQRLPWIRTLRTHTHSRKHLHNRAKGAPRNEWSLGTGNRENGTERRRWESNERDWPVDTHRGLPSTRYV